MTDLLNGQFFGGCPRDLINLISVLVKAQLNDALQSEVLRRVVELSLHLRLRSKKTMTRMITMMRMIITVVRMVTMMRMIILMMEMWKYDCLVNYSLILRSQPALLQVSMRAHTWMHANCATQAYVWQHIHTHIHSLVHTAQREKLYTYFTDLLACMHVVCMCIHAHKHVYVCTHTQTHTHSYTLASLHAHAPPHPPPTLPHTHTHAHTDTHTHDTHRHAHADTHTQINEHTHKHHTHTHAHTYTHTHSHTCIHTHTHKYTHLCTYRHHTHTHTLTCMHAQTHTCTRAHTHLYLIPVARPHCPVLQVIDQWHGAFELIHTCLAGLHDLPVLVLNKNEWNQ